MVAMSVNVTENFFYNHYGRSGLRAWIFSTDHKRIGLLYMIGMLSFFSVGVIIGLLMKLELIAPGKTIVDARVYNSFFTVHGVIMIFLFIIPGIPAGFGNFMLPLQIGAKDVAFPRINLLSWWMYVTGGTLALFSLFGGGGAPFIDAGMVKKTDGKADIYMDTFSCYYQLAFAFLPCRDLSFCCFCPLPCRFMDRA
jgi:hypothetical protein